MQSEVRVHCSASLAVFGADDVPPFAGSSQWILRLAEGPAEQASQRGQATDRSAPEGMGRERQGRRLCKLHDDLLDQGEMCCPNRVARLTRLAGIKAQIGYKRRPGIYGGRPAGALDN